MRSLAAVLLLLVSVIILFIGHGECQNMTLMSGQVISLPELYKATNYSCCIPQSFLGDYTSITKLTDSQGKFYVTADPNCKDPNLIVPAAAYPAQYRSIWACGGCEGGKCPAVDGGVDVALPGDYCTTPDNKPDPSVVCSTAAPICNAGYSGKCEAVPSSATQAITSGPSLTLQSGLVVDLTQLQQQYQGQCCLPRSVVNDFDPIMRIDNSNGHFFVSDDPNCNTPLDSRAFPASFDYIHVCDQCPPGGCFDTSANAEASAGSTTVYIINGGPTLLPIGASSCDPYDYYGGACWGAAPFCSFAGVCAGIPSYGYNWGVGNGGGYGYDYGYGGGGGCGWGCYRPRWWLPLRPVRRPGYWRPPVFRPGWGYPGGICRPGQPRWRPINRPDNWHHSPLFRAVRGGLNALTGLTGRRPQGQLWRQPGVGPVGPLTGAGLRSGKQLKGGRVIGPGVLLPKPKDQGGNKPAPLPAGTRSGTGAGTKSGAGNPRFNDGQGPKTIRTDGGVVQETSGGGTRKNGGTPNDNNPTGTNPTVTNPAGTNPTGTKATGTNPTGAKQSGAIPTGTNPTDTKPTGTNPAGAKPGTGKPSGTNPSATSGTTVNGGTPDGGSIRRNTPNGPKPSGTTLNGNGNGADIRRDVPRDNGVTLTGSSGAPGVTGVASGTPSEVVTQPQAASGAPFTNQAVTGAANPTVARDFVLRPAAAGGNTPPGLGVSGTAVPANRGANRRANRDAGIVGGNNGGGVPSGGTQFIQSSGGNRGVGNRGINPGGGFVNRGVGTGGNSGFAPSGGRGNGRGGGPLLYPATSGNPGFSRSAGPGPGSMGGMRGMGGGRAGGGGQRVLRP